LVSLDHLFVLLVVHQRPSYISSEKNKEMLLAGVENNMTN